jgi:tyrosyl-tRNA synthetase
MVPLLVGTDGAHKMSKSLGNYIGVAETPNDIYGKVMSLADNMILQYFELLTDVPDAELAELRKQMDSNTINPMVLKKRLAFELVVQLYDEKEAAKAEEHFTKVHQQKEIPENIPEIKVDSTNPDIRKLLVSSGTAASASEATRLIKQGAIEIDGEKISNFIVTVKNGSVIKVGKHRFFKIVIHS